MTSLEKADHVLDGTPEQTRRLVSAGQPNVMTELRIVRADGSECAPGEAGELLIKNPDLVMQGCWRNEAATAEAMRDGWFHTGDVGTLDTRGYLTIVDRIKDMIISGGENIYPRELGVGRAHHPGRAARRRWSPRRGPHGRRYRGRVRTDFARSQHWKAAIDPGAGQLHRRKRDRGCRRRKFIARRCGTCH